MRLENNSSRPIDLSSYPLSNDKNLIKDFFEKIKYLYHKLRGADNLFIYLFDKDKKTNKEIKNTIIQSRNTIEKNISTFSENIVELTNCKDKISKELGTKERLASSLSSSQDSSLNNFIYIKKQISSKFNCLSDVVNSENGKLSINYFISLRDLINLMKTTDIEAINNPFMKQHALDMIAVIEQNPYYKEAQKSVDILQSTTNFITLKAQEVVKNAKQLAEVEPNQVENQQFKSDLDETLKNLQAKYPAVFGEFDRTPVIKSEQAEQCIQFAQDLLNASNEVTNQESYNK